MCVTVLWSEVLNWKFRIEAEMVIAKIMNTPRWLWHPSERSARDMLALPNRLRRKPCNNFSGISSNRLLQHGAQKGSYNLICRCLSWSRSRTCLQPTSIPWVLSPNYSMFAKAILNNTGLQQADHMCFVTMSPRMLANSSSYPCMAAAIVYARPS